MDCSGGVVNGQTIHPDPKRLGAYSQSQERLELEFQSLPSHKTNAMAAIAPPPPDSCQHQSAGDCAEPRKSPPLLKLSAWRRCGKISRVESFSPALSFQASSDFTILHSQIILPGGGAKTSKVTGIVQSRQAQGMTLWSHAAR